MVRAAGWRRGSRPHRTRAVADESRRHAHRRHRRTLGKPKAGRRAATRVSAARRFGRISIAGRLIGISVILIGLMLGTSFYLSRGLIRAAATLAETQRLIELINTSHAARDAFADLRSSLTDLALSQTPATQQAADAARGRLKLRLNELAERRPAVAATIRGEVAAFDARATNAVAAFAAGQRDAGIDKLAAARDRGRAVDDMLDDLQRDLNSSQLSLSADAVGESAGAARTTVRVEQLAIVLACVLTVLVLRSILVPLGQLVTAVEATLRGDLTAPLPPPSGDELGALTRAVQSVRDGMVERERLQRDAEKQRQLMADAIECINEGFVLYDADDRLVLCNSNFATQLQGLGDLMVPGVPFLSVIEATVARGIVDLQGSDGAAWIAERMRTHREPQGTMEFRFRDRWVRIGERSTTDGGTVAIYSDISEIKRRQDALEAARQEAVQASQAKSEFLAKMSHELRTPLNAIIGYSQLLQEDAEDTGNIAPLADLRKIENAGKHLLGLIDGILDLSKVEAGRMDVFVEPIDVPALVEDVRLLVEPLAARNGNTLVVDCPADAGAIRSDATKLKQSLLNLLSNACKFTDQGTVTLSVRRAEAAAGTGMIAFDVADTGVGMSEEQVARLFQAFVQADNSTTRRFGGTGLGLAITRSFARMLGGDVTVASRLGAGSTFTLVLPVAQPGMPGIERVVAAAAPAETADEVVGRGANGGRILVIDDDLAARQIIGSYLAREGYRLSYAATGAEGLEKARASQPDAITLDIMMPHLDGWSVLAALKHDAELRHIPVVMVSVAGDRGLGFSLGAAASLSKPVDRNDLVRTLQGLLQTPSDGVVLIVEDDPPTRELAERTVASLGHRSALAGNGREAFGWLAVNPRPRLIVLDLLMPEMDGFAFLTRLRGRAAWKDIPVIVVTAKEIGADERRELAALTQQIVAKGHSGHLELARALREVLAPAPAGGVA
jgi:signal transduction histidine kinase/DNA-binding response OmpR family regulator